MLSAELAVCVECCKNIEDGQQRGPSGGRGSLLAEGRYFRHRESTWKDKAGSHFGATANWLGVSKTDMGK